MKKYLKTYLYNRPVFYSFIRPRELLLFRKQFPLKKPILDFGCGDGFFAKILFGNKSIDAGIDIDERVLPDAKMSGVYKKVFLYNGKKLLFKNGAFSTVISNCVMEHVDGLSGVLKEINRITKKGGRLYMSVMTDKWENHLLGGKIFGKKYLLWMRKIQRHPNLLSESDWEKRFNKAGYKVVDKIGYIDQTTSRLIESFHYLSIDSLISYKFFKKWVLFPQRFTIVENMLHKYIQARGRLIIDSSAVFYFLEKK